MTDVAYEPSMSNWLADYSDLVVERAIASPVNEEPVSENNDDNEAGGRERAALATVFGVQEYTTSNTFWVQQQDEGKKASSSHTRETVSQDETVTKGPIPVVIEHKITSFEAPQLPDIPQVSKFNDFLVEDEHGSLDIMLPANPSSVLLHSLSPPLQRSLTLSSVQSSILTVMPESSRLAATTGATVIQPPRLFIGHPPSIFDLLQSDDDDRIIIWGNSAASLGDQHNSHTTLTAEDNASVASDLSKAAPPPVQGFATNTTVQQQQNKRRPKLVNSAHSLLADGIHRLSRQKSLPIRKARKGSPSENEPPIPQRPLLKRASFSVKRSSNMLYVDNASSGTNTPPAAPSMITSNTRVIEAASVEKLVEKLTSTLDYTLMTDFFLTYRTFISATQLCKLLILRFRWAFENDQEDRCVVRIRTFVVMRHWLLNYFVHDFLPSHELRVTLTSFLNSFRHHAMVQQSPRDQRIVRGLKRVVRRLKAVHCQEDDPSNTKYKTLPGDYWADSTMTSIDNVSDCSDDTDLTPGDAVSSLDEEDVILDDDENLASMIHERRRREEEEERQRAQFFTSNLSEGSSMPSLMLAASDVGSFPGSEPVTPMHEPSQTSLDGYHVKKLVPHNSGNNKRPVLPPSFLEQDPMVDEDLSVILPDLKGGRQYLPATIVHDMTPEMMDKHQQQHRQLRRVPSNRWCRARPEEAPHYQDRTVTPADVLKTAEDVTNSGPNGLSRRLSRKSIEKRKSEKSLRDAAASSAATTPHLVSTTGHYTMIPIEDDLPPLPAVMPAAKKEATESTSTIASSSAPKAATSSSTTTATSSTNETLEALPYSMTAAVMSPPATPTFNKSNSMSSINGLGRRRLSKKLSKIFSKPKDAPSTPAPPSPPPMPVCLVQPIVDGSEKVEIVDEPQDIPLLGRIAATLKDDDDENPDESQEEEELTKKKKLRVHRHAGPIYLSQLASESTLNLDFENDEPEPVKPAEEQKQANRSSMLSMDAYGRPMSLIVEPDAHMASEAATTEQPAITEKNEPKGSFILQHRATKLAQHFCLIERQVLLGVTWEELVDCRWRQTSGHTGGVQKLIARFNAVCQWVQTEIVTTADLEERVQVICKFIRLAQKCKALNNFSTLLQILLGLQSPAVSRLTETWTQVGASEMRVLNALSTFTSPSKNWKNVRDCMTVLQNSDDAEGCIPFLGIYLSDLIFNAQLPPYLESKKDETDTPPILQQPLVHFRKHRITATVIKRILTFQNLARRYPFSAEPVLLSQCQNLVVLDSDKIRLLSLERQHDHVQQQQHHSF